MTADHIASEIGKSAHFSISTFVEVREGATKLVVLFDRFHAEQLIVLLFELSLLLRGRPLES